MTRTPAVILAAALAAHAGAQTDTPAWTFASVPDLFNADIGDLAGGATGLGPNTIPAAPGFGAPPFTRNGVTPGMLNAYNTVLQRVAQRNPEALVVAGDLINAVWFNGNQDFIDMFAPARSRADAITNACEIYYGWYHWLINNNGIPRIIPAIGDHEIGDNTWNTGGEKASLINHMKQAFDTYMLAPLNAPANVTASGVPARPFGTDYQHGSFAYQLNNVLFVTVDVFRHDGPNTELDPLFGALRPELTLTHLSWLNQVLSAATHDAHIDHVIVQGHTPAISPVRLGISSGMMIADREDSSFWTTLRLHDHTSGGKVRFYLAGEVHSSTAAQDPMGDIIQLVHGNPPLGGGGGEYVIFTVEPDAISAELVRFDLSSNTNDESYYWQANNDRTLGPSGVTVGSVSGSITIDTSTADTLVTSSGWLELVDPRGLPMHYSFDRPNTRGFEGNGGQFGNLNHAAQFVDDAAVTADGFFGDALLLDGQGDHAVCGPPPVGDGEQRTVAAWINATPDNPATNADDFRNIVACGLDRDGINGRFNFRLFKGVPQLNINQNITVQAHGAPRLDDGAWHHVAVVVPNPHANTLADITFAINGVGYPAAAVGPTALTEPLRTLPGVNEVLIGVGHSGSFGFFDGRVDDVAFWSRALSATELNAVYRLATNPATRLNVQAAERLLRAFANAEATVRSADRIWHAATDLTSAPGTVADLTGNRLAIALDADGNGYITDAPDRRRQLVVNGDFDTPDYPRDGETTPDFDVWHTDVAEGVWGDRSNGGRVPGDNPNQVARPRVAGVSITQDLTADGTPFHWQPLDVYRLAFNAIEPPWQAASAGNAVVASLEQTDGTILWSSGQLSLDGTHPDAPLDDWPAGTTFSFDIPAEQFTAAAAAQAGTPLRLRLRFPDKAAFVDNVSLEVIDAACPADRTGDGLYNADDVNHFLAALADGPALATDRNGDNTADATDLFAYLEAGARCE